MDSMVSPAAERGRERQVGSAEEGHPRSLLRRALAELGTLSGELSAAEGRLEADRAEALSRAAAGGEKQAWDVEEWARKQRGAIAAEYEQRCQQLAQQREQAEREAKGAYGRAAAVAKQTADEQVRAIRKSMEEGVWLADSLLEGAEAAAAKQTKEANDAYAKAIAALDERAVRHAEVLGMYGMQHLVLESPPEPSAAVTGSATMGERHAKEAEEKSLARLGERESVLEGLELARAFVGLKPYAIGAALVAVGGVVGQLTTGGSDPDPVRIAIGAGVGLVVAVVAAVGLKVVANRGVKAAYAPLRQEAEDARAWAGMVRQLTLERIELDLKAARARREDELRLVKDRHQPKVEQAEKVLKEAMSGAEKALKDAMSAASSAFEAGMASAAELRDRRTAEMEARYAREKEAAGARAEAERAKAEAAYAEGKAALERRWHEGLSRVAWAMKAGGAVEGTAAIDWGAYTPEVATLPRVFPPAIRFGELRVDVAALEAAGGAEGAKPEAGGGGGWRFGGVLPERFGVPAVLGFGVGATTDMGNLMIDFERNGRDGALSMLRGVMSRLLVGMPAGRVRLTMIDPVGLGETFAGFMHLADYDEQLTGPRIWTDAEAIDRRLQDLTEHMETVIQKYLRNEFDTIDAYNAQAGELAEPYRFLVVADFPTGWSTEALRKLGSVLASGARCGVHVLLARDVRVALERRVLEDVRAGVTVVEVQSDEATKRQGDAGDGLEELRLRWRDEVFGRFALVGDGEPSDAGLTALCQAVGEGARRANRVEVDVGAVLPTVEKRWTWSSAEEFRVPVGRSGATRLQYMKLGKGVSQHALLAGKTGSGKSTLLHVMVTASALWYSPDEVEFYLIDFKKGVEFKTYVDGKLPHVKAVAVESDREFGLSVLQRLDAELTRRGEMFRKAGVQDIASYRAGGGEKLPRVLLVVDEFQEFFVEDDKLSQEAAGLLDRLVRQGRAFGMHVVLGSQTIGGSAGLPRATLGQMAVRVALQTGEADSALILGDGNTAARLLTRPGEAIYNDNGGLPEANSPFQVAWLSEERRDRLLAEVTAEGKKRGWSYDAVVFEGNKPADFGVNRDFRKLMSGADRGRGVSLIGEPVAIKPTTRVEFRRQPGANLLLIGQQEEAAMATMQACVLSLAAGEREGEGHTRFMVLEGTVEGSALKGALAGLADVGGRLGVTAGVDLMDVPYREAEEAIGRAHAEMRRRIDAGDGDAGGWDRLMVMIYGLQRYRGLRRSGDDFSFSMSGEEKKLSADKMLAELAKEGPAVGVHVVIWADTLTAVERVFERSVMREFDHRVLFQMSANDSSALIDSPAANRLGPFRGLLFSEEQGTLEKFRPFAVLGV